MTNFANLLFVKIRVNSTNLMTQHSADLSPPLYKEAQTGVGVGRRRRDVINALFDLMRESLLESSSQHVHTLVLGNRLAIK